MDYADVVEVAFATGPKWSAKYSKPARYFLQVWLFLTYFTACSADNIIIATNFGQVFRYYMNYESLAASNNTGVNNATGINNTDVINVTETINSSIVSELVMAPIDDSQLRIIMGFVLLPLILLVWVPDLKYLAPISMLANIFMACVIGITCFYLVQDMKSISDLTLFQPVTRAPQFICITLFAMENIGVIMPLENNMKKPKNFLGAYGVLNRGMSSITLVYLIVGILGYMKYGENVSPIITTNLPVTHIAAQIVKILIGLTILFAFSLQFYVCRDMVWTRTKKYFPSKPFLAEYVIRTLLVVACVSVAIIFPKIGPLVTLIGALGFSLLGIFGPVIIEIVTFWDIGFGRYYWMISKNILLMLFGILSLVFGSYSAVEEITRDLLDKK